jgi:hypothetical protein
MGNKRLFAFLLILVSFAALFAVSPYATITYAEGSSFMLVRNGKSSTVSLDATDVFGMEIQQGDIIQTAPSTFLEISIHSISASVQVAENTSFRCAADSSGTKVAAELYYGRVHAKVAKLTGSSSFKISTPSLVAGVRGTDFGCDVIAVRPSDQLTAVAAVSNPVLNRVFCFEGSVAIEDNLLPTAEPVLIAKNEMVEKVVLDTASGNAPKDVPQLQKKSIDPEVQGFWTERPFVQVSVLRDGREVTVLPHVWPRGREEKKLSRNLKIPGLAVATLVALGSAACMTAAAYSTSVGDGVFIKPTFSAGIVMVGSGSILALISALSN